MAHWVREAVAISEVINSVSNTHVRQSTTPCFQFNGSLPSPELCGHCTHIDICTYRYTHTYTYK